MPPVAGGKHTQRKNHILPLVTMMMIMIMLMTTTIIKKWLRTKIKDYIL